MNWCLMCGICPWETAPHSTYDNAHAELWDHYNTKHPYQQTSTGKKRRRKS